MPPIRAPRPRTFEDVCERLEKLDMNVTIVGESTRSLFEQLGKLAQEFATIRGYPFREESASYHDFDPEVAAFRATLRERVNDPADKRFTSERARAIARDAVQAAKRDDKAAHWDGLIRSAVRVGIGIAIGVIVALALARLGLGR